MKFLLLAFLFFASLDTQARKPGGPPYPAFSPDPVAESAGSEGNANSSALSLRVELIENDEELKKKYREYLLMRLNRELEKSKEQQDAGNFARLSAYSMYAIAHIFLGFGFFAAGREYFYAYKKRKQSTETHEIQVGLEGVALKTSLHGTLILV